MKILVTGVAGFLGSHLLDDLLARDHEVIGVDNLSGSSIHNIEHHLPNPKFKFYNLDASDYDALLSVSDGVDCICNLAALKKLGESNKSIRRNLLMSNLKCSTNVLDIASKRNCKVVFSSSSDVYGVSEDLPFSEDGDIRLGSSQIVRWSYAASKLFDEHIHFAYAEEFDIPIVIIRYFGAYGPRADYRFGEHIPLFIHKARSREPITIHGDGLQTRSMCYVSDVIKATVKLVETPVCNGRIINIGSDEEIPIVEQAKIISELVNPGEDPLIEFVDSAKVFGKYKEIRRRVPDLSLARELLDFEIEYDFRSGIRKMLSET